MSFIGRPCAATLSALWHAVEEKSYDHPGIVRAVAPFVLITKVALEIIEGVASIPNMFVFAGEHVFSEISFPLALPTFLLCCAIVAVASSVLITCAILIQPVMVITNLTIFELNPTKKAKQEALDADRSYHFFWDNRLPKERKNDTGNIGTKIASTKSFEQSLWNRFYEALQRAKAPDEIRNLHYADTEESRHAIFEEVLLKQHVLTTAAAVCRERAGRCTKREERKDLSEEWNVFQQELVNATSTEAQRLDFSPLVLCIP